VIAGNNANHSDDTLSVISQSSTEHSKPAGNIDIIWMQIPTLRYDTTEEFNVDLKDEYSALSSTRSQKKRN